MASDAGVITVLENCRISPPSNTVGERSLPLTFFDLTYLRFSPIHNLFSYEFPHSNPQTISILKHSLSITLKHFFPFASNLIVFDQQIHSKKPEIRHVEGDSVAFTVAECTLDFNDLIGNHPRACDKFHSLVPVLGGASKGPGFLRIPLFAVQVTVFAKVGLTIGLTIHHSFCDGRTRLEFLKAWTSIARNGTDEVFLASEYLPFYDRVIEYPASLDEICSSRVSAQTLYSDYEPRQLVAQPDRARATLVLTRAHINELKKLASTQLPTLEYVSSFSVACAFVWSCIAKSRIYTDGEKGEYEIERFVGVVDLRARLNPPVPQTYFGNCMVPCIASTKTSQLTGNRGFVVAAELLGNALSEILKNKDGFIKDAETTMEKAFKPIPMIVVAGSPKHEVYEIDFGWGQPKKYETISIDYSTSSISLYASKDSPEDFEIGLSLPTKQIDALITISHNELNHIFLSDQK